MGTDQQSKDPQQSSQDQSKKREEEDDDNDNINDCGVVFLLKKRVHQSTVHIYSFLIGVSNDTNRDI
jgi:hypothetical protein